MPEHDPELAAAHRLINERDPATQAQVKRLRGLYRQVDEDRQVAERAIAEIIEGGPGAADRLRGTADAVARLHGIQED